MLIDKAVKYGHGIDVAVKKLMENKEYCKYLEHQFTPVLEIPKNFDNIFDRKNGDNNIGVKDSQKESITNSSRKIQKPNSKITSSLAQKQLQEPK